MINYNRETHLACLSITVLLAYITRNSIQAGFALPTNFQKFKSGADPGFQVRRGALKKFAPSAGRREHFWDLSCEKSRFYAKKSYFFQLRREARKFLGYFVWKITILRQTIIYFPILGGGGGWRGPGAPPLDPPLQMSYFYLCWVCVSIYEL